VKTSSLLEFGAREEKAPDICPVQCLLSGAVTTVRRSSRPLEMDGWHLKLGHVDGQRPPDRGHRTELSVRCVLSGAPAQITVGESQRLYLEEGL
jgi:hypothetical protein